MASPVPRVCSVARSLEVVGEKWSLLVVREVLLGVRRFDQIRHNTGAPRDVLAARLRTLVETGVLARRRYSERPPRDEYVLTPAGRDLRPVVLALMRWGDAYLAGESGPPMVLRHECGADFQAEVVCAACHQQVRGRDLERVVLPSSAGAPSDVEPARA